MQLQATFTSPLPCSCSRSAADYCSHNSDSLVKWVKSRRFIPAQLAAMINYYPISIFHWDIEVWSPEWDHIIETFFFFFFFCAFARVWFALVVCFNVSPLLPQSKLDYSSAPPHTNAWLTWLFLNVHWLDEVTGRGLGKNLDICVPQRAPKWPWETYQGDGLHVHIESEWVIV